MGKIYDVYFTLAEDACVAIEAKSEEEAEEIFNNMTEDELNSRIYDAVSYGGFEITDIEEIN